MSGLGQRVRSELKAIHERFEPKRALREDLNLGYEFMAGVLSQRDKELRSKLKLPFRQNLRRIEIEVTTLCNLKCFNCDRSARQAPSDERMTKEQIRKFVDESIALKHKWAVISVLGGEPTLHPDILEIFQILLRYKAYYYPCRIIMITNGYGPKVKRVIEKVPKEIKIGNTYKEGPAQPFGSYNLAPIDENLPSKDQIDYATGCEIISHCGLALTRYGYYACGAGASSDRIFGWNTGLKNLAEVTRENLRQQLQTMCRFCGHFKDLGIYRDKYQAEAVFDEVMSPSWVEAYQRYERQAPKLTTY
jgi:organic radical activating enzyme